MKILSNGQKVALGLVKHDTTTTTSTTTKKVVKKATRKPRTKNSK